MCSFFQDLNLTWNTNDPDFSVCFQKSALLWVPCAWILVTAPIYAVYLRMVAVSAPIPHNRLNITKTVCICTYVCTRVCMRAHTHQLACTHIYAHSHKSVQQALQPSVPYSPAISSHVRVQVLACYQWA